MRVQLVVLFQVTNHFVNIYLIIQLKIIVKLIVQLLHQVSVKLELAMIMFLLNLIQNVTLGWKDVWIEVEIKLKDAFQEIDLALSIEVLNHNAKPLKSMIIMILTKKLMCTFYALEMLPIQIIVNAKIENVQTILMLH